jgi:hypothetical protein
MSKECYRQCRQLSFMACYALSTRNLCRKTMQLGWLKRLKSVTIPVKTVMPRFYVADPTYLCQNFGLRLYEICAWGIEVKHLCSSRSEWVRMESLRR